LVEKAFLSRGRYVHPGEFGEMTYQPLMDAKFSSALARKLNSFVELSKDELGVLVDLQSKPLKIKRGQALIEEGQTGHKAFILQTGLGLQLQDLARRQPPDH